MKGNRITDIILMMIAMYVAALSMVFGLRHLGYLLAATLSATLI